MTPDETAPKSSPRFGNRWTVAVLTALFSLFAGIRVFALDADPPTGLSWSAGIFSDEGIYALDARSVALTGHWAPGDFHSALVAPLLHLVQCGVFKIFGVGLIQARLISVAFGLATLAFFFAALRRSAGDRPAWMGVALLGMSVPFVFYNRLALLETPTLFWLMLAFFVWARGGDRFLVGALVGVAVVFKPLAFLCVPAFALGIWPDRRALLFASGGIGIVLLTYAVAWYLPHHATLARMNHYYAYHQYLLHSWRGVWHNIARGLWTGEADGVLPYLFIHALPLSLIALASLFYIDWKTTADRLFAAWMLTPIFADLLLGYTPSRYFVLFWPALAALAARALSRLEPMAGWSIVGLISLMSLIQIAGIFSQRAYTLRDDGMRLAQNAPSGTLIAGQFAPALCLSNRLVPLYVQPGLANDRQPLPAAPATAILVTRSASWDRWWREQGPVRIGTRPDRSFDLDHRYRIDVYLHPTAVMSIKQARKPRS